jgi:hypothetical protein
MAENEAGARDPDKRLTEAEAETLKPAPEDPKTRKRYTAAISLY